MSREESARPSVQSGPKTDPHDAATAVEVASPPALPDPGRASPFPRVSPARPGRPGVQLESVLRACDEMILKGLRPTIERVRQELGGGSPNTVAPMLEEWFRRLPMRLAGTSSLEVRVAPPDGGTAAPAALEFPFEVSQAAKHLWDTAMKNAEQTQARETQAVRRQLELQTQALSTGEGELQRREVAFEEARKSLDAALASSQAAREALERQLADQAADAAAYRKSADQEIARLGRQLIDAHSAKDALRAEHAAALARRDQAAQEAEDRHVAGERRLLQEVDRAREEAKQAALANVKERTARTQLEHQLAEVRDKLNEELRTVRAAAAQVKVDADLRIAEQVGILTQLRAELEGTRGRLQEAQALHAREMVAHEATRELLKQAMAAPSDRAEALPAPPPGRTRGPRKRDTD